MKSKICRTEGFTLMELIIVVAIILVLGAIAMPLFAQNRQKAYNTTAISDIKNSKSSLEMYFEDNRRYPN